jgi:glyoxylase-like metal-dependent hydrolase (beta-lactamase superfamily II)
MITRRYTLGSSHITRVSEKLFDDFAPTALLPLWDDGAIAGHRSWLVPDNLDLAGEKLIISVHTWVIKTPQYTVLVDTGVGNAKSRPELPIFHQLNEPWLERLAAAGVTPEEVDYVLLTHLHIDHIGWNTHLVDGRWVPTFPNAKYVFPRVEYEHFLSLAGRQSIGYQAFVDSVLPVVESGQAVMIGAEGGPFLENFHFHPTQGHSVGHMSISHKSDDEIAMFGGDVMHHPIQVSHPLWASCFCDLPAAANRSREWLLSYLADHNALYFSSHFAGTSAGRVTRQGDGYTWHFA